MKIFQFLLFPLAIIFAIPLSINAQTTIDGGVTPEVLYGSKKEATLWAYVYPDEGATIDRVWVVISLLSGGGKTYVDLVFNPNLKRYEILNNFTEQGQYVMLFYAEDSNGNQTNHADQAILEKSEPSADDYEEDDTKDQANPISLNYTPQERNFHDKRYDTELGEYVPDEDWVKFYGTYNINYTIKVVNKSDRCDAVIELYRKDGVTLIKSSTNENTAGKQNSISWVCDETDIYFVRLFNKDPDKFGSDVAYTLEVYKPEAGDEGTIYGTVMIKGTDNQRLSDVTILIDGEKLTDTDEQGSYFIKKSPGEYTLTAKHDEYFDVVKSVIVTEATDTEVNIAMQVAGDLNNDKKITIADVILCLKIMSGINSPGFGDADVNQDGKIGLENALYGLRKLATQ